MRAWYFQSLEYGTELNRELLLGLTVPLIESGKLQQVEQERIRRSLRAAQAKVWLAEVGKEPDPKCRACAGQWSGPQHVAGQIVNGRWEKRDDDYRGDWGRRAPYLTKLRVLGGFVNDRDDEWLAPDKIDRASHIRDFGWS
jgi:hypothetical protein